MKSKFKLFTILFALALFAVTAGAVETEKEFHKAWPVGDVETLEVSNKFGEVKINNDGGSEVTIDVVVTIEAANMAKAEKLLEYIDIEFDKSGKTASAETDFDNDFKHQQKFSVDYSINIPSNKNLKIENKFGNVVVNELNAKGDFEVAYGNFSAVKLNGLNKDDIKIELAYGKGNIEEVSDAVIEVKYSKLFIGSIGDLDLESKYSVMTIEEMGKLTVESKYDTFNLEEVEAIAAETKYSNFKVEELKKSLKISTGYGGIKVNEVSADFELIDITNSYGQISLGISENASYDVKASCDYCGISYDESNFNGNRETDNHTKKIDGKIGSGASSAKVIVTSRYGSIKLKN